jgi:hypothetical protein
MSVVDVAFVMSASLVAAAFESVPAELTIGRPDKYKKVLHCRFLLCRLVVDGYTRSVWKVGANKCERAFCGDVHLIRINLGE